MQISLEVLLQRDTIFDWQQRDTIFDWQQHDTIFDWQQRDTIFDWQQCAALSIGYMNQNQKYIFIWP